MNPQQFYNNQHRNASMNARRGQIIIPAGLDAFFGTDRMARQSEYMQLKDPPTGGRDGDPKALTGVTKEPPGRRFCPVCDHVGMQLSPCQGGGRSGPGGHCAIIENTC